MRRPDPRPIKYRAMSGQHAQRRPACIRSFPHGRFAIKIRRKENAFRIGVEQNLLRIEAVNSGNGSSPDTEYA